MKILILILSFIFIDSQCSESKELQNNISFEYTVVTRGYYKKILIKNKTVSIFKKRESPPTVKTCSEETWKRINDMLKSVDLEQLRTLESPSENRFVDAAAIANLKITHNGKTYKTESFDDGNPPKEIDALVKEILSIAQNVE